MNVFLVVCNHSIQLTFARTHALATRAIAAAAAFAAGPSPWPLPRASSRPDTWIQLVATSGSSRTSLSKLSTALHSTRLECNPLPKIRQPSHPNNRLGPALKSVCERGSTTFLLGSQSATPRSTRLSSNMAMS
eukprot:5369972-Pleurochrysis_carterae.AAC.3